MSRVFTVPAWRVNEGDMSPGGARVVSVQRDPARGHVRIGLSTGATLDLAGESRFLVAERAHDEPARRCRVIGVFIAASRIGRRRVPPRELAHGMDGRVVGRGLVGTETEVV